MTLFKTFLCPIFLNILPRSLTFYSMRKIFQEIASSYLLLWLKFTLQRVAKFKKKKKKVFQYRNLQGKSYQAYRMYKDILKPEERQEKNVLKDVMLPRWPRIYLKFYNWILGPILKYFY